ncbi:MAG: hypothetical protein GX442_10885 [Candidatus Riflebacteria bacterium]|nr:hypothetical protein [Candidatus Riflebacteria bacterium]
MYQLFFILFLISPAGFWYATNQHPVEAGWASLVFYGLTFAVLFILKVTDALGQITKMEAGELSQLDAEVPIFYEEEGAMLGRSTRIRLHYLGEVLLAGFLLAGFCYGANYVVSTQAEEILRYGAQPFDQAAWVATPDKRYPMILDLLQSHPLAGKTPEEVTALLGAPNASQTSPTTGATHWLFGLGTRDHPPGPETILHLTFQQGRVSDARRTVPVSVP